MRRALAALFGLLLVCLARPVHAEDWAPCRSEGYLSHFDERMTPQACDVVTTVTIPYRSHAITLRAIHRRASPMSGDPGFLALMRNTAAAIGAAMNQMGPGLRLGDVTVFYNNALSASTREGRETFLRGGVRAETTDLLGPVDSRHPGAARECPINFYKATGRSSDQEILFTLAHEVFHCIQYSTWPALIGASGKDWQIEGSAEYFAYLAQPAGSGNEGFIRNFDNQIVGSPLSAMNYPAVVYFLWLGQANGPQSIPPFLRDSRTLEDLVTPDQWFKFAQDYEDNKIQYPDGRGIASSPVAGRSRTISGADNFVKPSLPFTINTYTYAFARGKIFDLTYSEMPKDGREAWRKLDGADWADPPANVTTCDGEKRYRVLWTTTSSSTAGRTRIAARPATQADCTCPAGSWQETEQSTRHIFEQSAFTAGQAKHYIGGTRTLQLNADHTGSFTYNSVEVRVGNPGDEVWLHQVVTGGTHFTWNLVGGLLLTVYTPGVNLVTLHNEMHTPGRVINETRQAGAQSIGHYFHCDDAGLHLTQNTHTPLFLPGAANFSVNMDFVRTGGP